jgi:hypothetical protein
VYKRQSKVSPEIVRAIDQDTERFADEIRAMGAYKLTIGKNPIDTIWQTLGDLVPVKMGTNREFGYVAKRGCDVMHISAFLQVIADLQHLDMIEMEQLHQLEEFCK